MKIEGTTARYLSRLQARKLEKPRKPIKAGKDEYVPSPEARKLALDAIRQKMNSGFYSSEKVADDISDKLSKLFDQD